MLPHTPDGDWSAAPAELLLIGDESTAPVPLRWRGFGTLADLDLNFQGAARNAIVTELLALCRHGVNADLAAYRTEARRLTLAGRIGGLAAIVARTTSTADIALELRCPVRDCREALQIALSLGSLLELSRQAESQRWITVRLPDAQSLRVRRPTGNDQHGWQSCAYADVGVAERALVASLLAEPQESVLSYSTVLAIDAALDDADPLTCFRITTACPVCEQENDHAVDLEALLLARLQRTQRAILHDIHRLAARYGWSESEIVAMPTWRRRSYLDFLDREES